MTGEELGFLLEKLISANTLDVWYTPIVMKKNRPAYMISILAEKDFVDDCIYLLFKYSTTLGCRLFVVEKREMHREFETIFSQYGDVNIKRATYKDIVKSSYEYEDIKIIAEKLNVSISDAIKYLKI